jgi:hypothetical protein
LHNNSARNFTGGLFKQTSEKTTMMKKPKAIKEPLLKQPVAGEPVEQVEEDSNSEQADVNSIQEFIELKKLQNKILKKMIEKINHSENKTNNN